MKKISLYGLLTFVIVVMLSIGLTSCGDDDGASYVASDMYGTWTETKKVDDEGRTKTYDDASRYMSFNQDGTGTINPYNMWEVEIPRKEFTWTVNGNKLNITYWHNRDAKYYTEPFTIIKLTATEIELKWEDIEEGVFYGSETITFVKH